MSGATRAVFEVNPKAETGNSNRFFESFRDAIGDQVVTYCMVDWWLTWSLRGQIQLEMPKLSN